MTDVVAPNEATGSERFLGLRPRSSADTEGEVARVLRKLEVSGKDATVARLVANAPSIFRPFVMLSDALLHRSALPPRIREVVVLHLATRTGSAYEREEHEKIARDVGLDDEVVAHLRDADADGAGLRDDERAALRLAAAVLAGSRDIGAPIAAARRHLDEQMVLELVLCVAWWGGFVPLATAALGLEARDVG